MNKKIFLKYYPFWLGLAITLFVISETHEFSSILTLFVYLIGYFKLTKFHKDE